MSRTLPEGSKEASLFRKMLRSYESKQYKAGLKCAKSILERKPKHGETLAMQALITNAMDKHDEAMELCHEAVKADLGSGMCWHVRGILYRQKCDYDQALRSFLRAAQIEAENQTILRDLSHLQVQVRDYEGFRDTRRKFLELRGGVRASWLGYGVAQHMTGEISGAIETMTQYLGLQDDANTNAYETSEMHMYVVMLMMANNEHDRALTYLNDYEEKIVDRRSIEETRAQLLLNLNRHQDRLGQRDDALATIRRAIDHTPTVVELYMVEGRILKHLGRLDEAATQVDFARQLDTADRFINSKAAKYLLRAGRIEEGQTIAGLFARETRNTDPLNQLRDMQCSWYELECAKAYLAKGDLGNALAHLHAVKSFYKQLVDDQFDFHSYCLRKVNLRAYTRLLKYEDEAYFHKRYVQTAAYACSVYAELHNNPFGSAKEREEQERLAKMSESERKKYLSKQRKAAKKGAGKGANHHNARGKKGAQQDNKNKDKEQKGKKSKTPQWNPNELVQTSKALDDALVFLQPLLNFPAVEGMESLLEPAVDVLVRRKRPLLVIKALRTMTTTDVPRHVLIASTLKLMRFISTNADAINPTVREIIDEELPQLVENKSEQDLRKELEDLASKSLAAFACAQLLKRSEGVSTSDVIAAITDKAASLPATLDEAAAVWLSVANVQDMHAGKSELRAALQKRFPDAHVFTQHQLGATA
ncbi:hypothetical protein PTSG_05385 [Salpingoeca rosetta]|uniref:Uncharacterized protein n=1 Tax=Salpingoeca rosetta (strain ATCC 50818 / BSB-021) TaxID=946362 RepID=F2UA97_SALR5|nr:uncharacterized protein PTSG_05385 [Salpingoeca rosetta]EGD73672.1 hypothetical protein PTSG_05385 [Salpingoeca rosetta]|eukprot:XP_004993953.1 hypothetical protein PTSG_05385 [Salpingoeca rosetta]